MEMASGLNAENCGLYQCPAHAGHLQGKCLFLRFMGFRLFAKLSKKLAGKKNLMYA